MMGEKEFRNDFDLFCLQEKYLSALVSATPVFASKHASAWGMSDSSLSIDSLFLAAEDPLVGGTLTPEVVRRSNPFNKAMGTLGYLSLFYYY